MDKYSIYVLFMCFIC